MATHSSERNNDLLLRLRGYMGKGNATLSRLAGYLICGSGLMDVLKREKLSAEQIAERSRTVILMKWHAWKTIEAGGTVSVGEKWLYDSVRKRLKSIWRGQEKAEEKLARFRYIKDEMPEVQKPPVDRRG